MSNTTDTRGKDAGLQRWMCGSSLPIRTTGLQEKIVDIKHWDFLPRTGPPANAILIEICSREPSGAKAASDTFQLIVYILVSYWFISGQPTLRASILTMRTGILLPPLACLIATAVASTAQTHLPNNGATNGTSKAYTNEQIYPLGGYKHFDCGTNKSLASDHLIAFHKSLANNSSRNGSPAARARLATRQSSPITVNTVFHIVATTDQQSLVQLPWGDAQIAAMNQMYNNYSISFNLINTTWTVSDAWGVGAGNDMSDMKTALRQGDYSTLNIYFMTNLTGGILGTCSMPTNISSDAPSSYTDDGCCVNAGTMPGGPIYGYNEGMTAVHETGHWLGLFHVFENYSCTGDGDYIDDTPMQSVSTNGCPTAPPPQNSCPDSPGYDSIHNIMDYSDDACYEGFTGDQQQRMQAMWGQYRQGK